MFGHDFRYNQLGTLRSPLQCSIASLCCCQRTKIDPGFRFSNRHLTVPAKRVPCRHIQVSPSFATCTILVYYSLRRANMRSLSLLRRGHLRLGLLIVSFSYLHGPLICSGEGTRVYCVSGTAGCVLDILTAHPLFFFSSGPLGGRSSMGDAYLGAILLAVPEVRKAGMTFGLSAGKLE